MAYNFARRLKTLKGLTPYEYVCKIWTEEPERFNVDPFQHTLGLNSYAYSDNSKEFKGTDGYAFVKACRQYGISQKFCSLLGNLIQFEVEFS